MAKYLNISETLQIVRGEGCLFVSKLSDDDLESVETQISEWLLKNVEHHDAPEAQRWLDAAAPRIARIRKERQIDSEVAAFKSELVARLQAEGDTWAAWRVERYQYPALIRKFEKELREKLELD